MLRDEVTPDDIASVVAAWTGARVVTVIVIPAHDSKVGRSIPQTMRAHVVV